MTFTPTATFTVEEVCDKFTVVNSPRQGQRLQASNVISFLYLAEMADALVQISIIHRQTGAEQGGVYPAAITLGGSFRLDDPGTYDWTIGIILQPYGELCQQSGTVTVLQAQPTPTNFTTQSPTQATAIPSPETTAQAGNICARFTVEPQFTEGQLLGIADTLSINLNIDERSLFVRVVVSKNDTDETHTIQIPGGRSFLAELPAELLFGEGTYTWTASLYSDAAGEQCITSGTFMLGSQPLLINTPTSTTPSTVVPTPASPTARLTATARPTATPSP
jgi:hypothetical protein